MTSPTAPPLIDVPDPIQPEPVSEPEAPPAFEADAVVGLWCEYWTTPTPQQGAPSRGADTQHYLFLEDGRWGWRAQAENGGEPRRRQGSWRVVGESIVLMDETGAAVERLPVNDCPPNPEAEEIDTRYRCRSLGGKAFWRTKPVTEVDTTQYIESPRAQ